MTPIFLKIILFSLIPVFTMTVSGIIGIYKKTNGNVRSLILHFAAGIVFSVVAVEILPNVVKEHKPFQVVIGFVLGLLTMLLIKHLGEDKQKETVNTSGKAIPMGLIMGIGVDIFIDGLLLGIGFSAGEATGTLLAIALSIELISLGIATATELVGNGVKKDKSIGIIASLAFLFFISAIMGATLLHNLSDSAMEIVLSFGLSALLFLVTEELLIEAHEEKETVWHTSVFFFGFLVFLILGMIV
ncbi:MAG: transporter [Pseudopedobacter saltans]|uniref:Transporter n=1 Tax=Pseudopedobacter saltans TaxID=151895 RepID=A0A2W5F0I7_9SPHI|nr:MAG: transporter [Pseudopedobacter saltans]